MNVPLEQYLENFNNDLELLDSNFTAKLDTMNIRYNISTGYVQLYYNTKWNNWAKGNGTLFSNPVLYSKGTDNTKLTGGWVAKAAKQSTGTSQTGTPTFTKNSTNMRIIAPYGKSSALMSGYSIDLTNYKYVKANISNVDASSCSLRVSTNNSNSYNSVKSTTIGAGDVSLNVSSLTGNHYIVFQLYMGGITINSIELVM